MRKSGVTATTAKSNVNISHDSIKARFFYQGIFALRKLNAGGKSKTPAKRTPASTSTDARKR